jgi:transposase
MSVLMTKSNGVTQLAGRKLLLTPELRELMAEKVRTLMYVGLAAESVGIHRATAARWMKLGESHLIKFHPDMDDCTQNCPEDSAAFRSFFDAIKRAQAESKLSSLKQIDNHAQLNWQAAAWKLERTSPEEFGIKGRVEHTGKDGGPIIHKHISVEQKKMLIKSAQEAIQLEENQEGIFEENKE